MTANIKKTAKKSAAAQSTEGVEGRTLRAANASDLAQSVAEQGKRATRFSDAVAAERLSKALGKAFCYCPSFGWMGWDGRVWMEVDDTVVMEESRKLHKKWYTTLIGRAVLEDPRSGAPIKRLLSKKGLDSVVSLCRGLLLVGASEFNKHHHLLNTLSGIVNLRTGKVLAHDKDLYLTKIAAVGYKPKAKHKDWTAVLSAMPADARRYQQVRCGQGLTGHPPSDDKIVFHKGGGENGKTTFITGITKPLGTYYRTISDKVLLAEANAHSTELTDLYGLRIAVIEELPEGSHLNPTLLKKATGAEITARRIRKDTFTFDTTHSLFVTHNPELYVSETNWGTWRRLERNVFPYTYVKASEWDAEDEGNPLHRKGDPTLRDRVREDAAVHEAALAWMVEGARKWYANGRKMPHPPKSVAEATLEWRKTSDLALRYWHEFGLELAEDHLIPSTAFHSHFNDWLRVNGHSKWSSQTFADRFGGHEVMEKVIGPKQVQVGKKWTVSWPPEATGGDGEKVAPFKAGKAWLGVRYGV